MEKYNYKEAIIQDIRNYIKDNDFIQGDETLEDYIQKLDEILWDEDSITGNGPFGYGYANVDHCEQCLAGNLRLAFEALFYFDNSIENLPHNEDELIKYLDTTIRCYLLHECIEEVVGGENAALL